MTAGCMICDKAPPPEILLGPPRRLIETVHRPDGGAVLQITENGVPRVLGVLCAEHYAQMRREVLPACPPESPD